MKRLATFILTMVLILSTFAFPATAHAAGNWTDGVLYNELATFDGGSGTSGNPYIISTPESLAQLAVNVNGGMTYKDPISGEQTYFQLGDDIDLSGAMWTPIGLWQWSGPDYPFSGTFNGLGHTISNMTVNDPAKIGVGLFGYTTGATIDGLGVTNCDVTGQGMAGGLAGFADELTSIHNCYYITGTVTAVYTDGAEGYNGEIVGGLVGNYGDALSSIDGCYSTANVDGDRFVGGLVGYMSAAHILNSYATGTVGLTSMPYDAGGFIGGCDQSIIENCYATGSVTSTGNAGGFAGKAYSNGVNNQIVNCYARGNVTACYTDPIDGSWGWATGGFIGSIGSTDISNCYSTGYISYAPATEAYHIGGFAGELNGGITFINCFVDTQVADRDAVGNGDDETSAPHAGITGLTTANMQGWDTLLNMVKMDGLDSGYGDPGTDGIIWFPHTSDYPDFVPESFNVAFDSRGATTPASPATGNAALGYPVDEMPSEPIRTGFEFGGWWTGTLGTGTEFTGTTPVPGEMIVYALWTNESAGSVYVGGRITLTRVGPAGGDWDYDEDYVTLEDLGDGAVRITGVAAGTTQVVYTTTETIETFDISITNSELPSTGQDDTPMYMMGGLALLFLGAGVAAGILNHSRREKRA